MVTQPLSRPLPATGRAELAAGWAAMLPFVLAALPGAFAYVVAARHAGLSQAETLLFSLLTCSAPLVRGRADLIAAGSAAILAALLSHSGVFSPPLALPLATAAGCALSLVARRPVQEAHL